MNPTPSPSESSNPSPAPSKETIAREKSPEWHTLIAAAKWIERIHDRMDMLPKSFLDNTDPLPIAVNLRAMAEDRPHGTASRPSQECVFADKVRAALPDTDFDEAHMWTLRQAAEPNGEKAGSVACAWAYDYIMQLLRALDRAGEVKGADEGRQIVEAFVAGASLWLPADADAEHHHELAALHLLHNRAVAYLHRAVSPPASVDAGTRKVCPVCNNDGFWVDVQPNRHTGDAEQVQVECEFCAMRNERDVTLARVNSLTAERDSLAEQLEEAKALFSRHTSAVATFLNELYAIAVDPLADEKMEVSEIKDALLKAAVRDRELRSALAEKEKECEGLSKGLLAYVGLLDNQPLPEDAVKPHFVLGCLTGELAGTRVELNKLRARLAALEADKRRLDWLERFLQIGNSSVFTTTSGEAHEDRPDDTEETRWNHAFCIGYEVELENRGCYRWEEKSNRSRSLRAAIDSALSANPRLLREGGEGK